MNATQSPSTSRRRQRRFLFGMVAAVLFAVPVAAVLWSNDAADPAPIVAATTGGELRWRGGDQRSYELRVLSSAGADDAGLQEIRGSLALRVFAVSDDVVEVGFQLADVVCAAGGARDSYREQAMATPFVAAFEPDGAAIDFRYPAGLDEDVEQQLAEIIRLFQVVVPSGSGAQWTTIEENGSGRFRAVYERSRDGQVHKRKAVFLSGAPLREDGNVVGNMQTRVLKSTAMFELARTSTWLDNARIDEELEYSSEMGLAARVATRAELTAIQESSDALLARAAVATDLLDYDVPALARNEAAGQDIQAAPATAQDIAVFEATLAQFEESDGADMSLLHKLAALVTQFPEFAERIPPIVARTDLEDRVGSGLIHVLELAGHEQGQTALVSILDDHDSSRRTILRAVVALAGVANPTPSSVERLWKIAHGRAAGAEDTVADTALLSLGRMGMSLHTTDAARYEELTANLLATLDSSMTAQSSAVALKAIGNTKDAELRPHVTARFSDQRAVVRAAAAKTLGVLESPEALSDLTSQLRHEPDGRVRAVIARSLGSQKSASAETFALCNALVENEDNPDARGAMARYLVDHLDTYPDARSTLERLIKTETNTQTLSYVAGRLYRKR